ncbi:MAG: RND transporter [Gammaproteobacteria bacterium 39-13]|nr:efflux transporter outer membrane subunit [Gammaproteobacteria bacterium]OJV93077.1 MAG: RND transporter [Gammaproteobacteria bacterium 39-13]
MPWMANKKICCVAIYATLQGCAVGPDFKSPPAPNTPIYTESPQPEQTVSAPVNGGKTQYLIAGEDIPELWWTLFHCEALNALIVQGIANSPNLKSAQAALKQAQENYRAQAGTYLYPTVDLQGFAERQKFSGAAFGTPDSTSSSIFNLFNTQVNVSYTLDVFGKNRRDLEALCAQVDYQRYQLEATYLALTANISTTAITEASLEAQKNATIEIIQLEQNLLNIVQKQFELGGASRSDVLSQESQLAQAKASLPPIEKSLAQTRHSLAILIGCLPSESDIPTFSLDALNLPEDLPISLPSRLVRQRPDIRASEALLHQASAQIGVATANLLPQFTINGTYGWEALKLSDLFKPSTNIWTIIGQITQPLFHGGALLAQRRAAIAAYEQALAQYRQTVLEAFQNVADALRAVEMDAKTLKAQAEAESTAKNLLIITQEQYQLGAVNYLSLLNAQNQYQQALIKRIQAQAARYTDTAALFQAIGGGWWNQDLIRELSNG